MQIYCFDDLYCFDDIKPDIRLNILYELSKKEKTVIKDKLKN